MRAHVETQNNVVRFPGALAARNPGRDQKGLMDTVYTMGSLPIAAADRETKALVARLQVFGFVNVDEIGLDGLARRLRPSETIRASTARPWRVSKPSLGAA